MQYNKKIILEDGSEYSGYGFGADRDCVCEIVFNTSMTGYQEILSDPSYTDQAVVMTYPLIGNYGMAEEDYETYYPTIGGLIVREYNDEPSNFRSIASLSDVMKKYGIPGIYGIDTRKVTRSIRELGSRKVLITGIDTVLEDGLSILRETELPHNTVSRVSSKEIWCYSSSEQQADLSERFHVVAVDCGIKHNILRSLKKRGCGITVVPWNTSADEIASLQPDGIFLSNGPGDPADVQPVIEMV
ncbi:MAG: carbamoyl phosphate synthase small subunit, partial [Peptococcaceae bacterium]|nr:carbamoyl phosphate synthase small subunit [Peptococcaceae bacterium]